MPFYIILKIILHELLTFKRSHRIAEPDLVMNDPEKVAAYYKACDENGVMASVYLFQAAQISEVIRPGDVVLDLGCGPGIQLALVARLNPETNFIGIDLSPKMLERAKAYVIQHKLSNIEFREANVTDLSFIENQSIDAVISTVALHHLPEIEMLDKTFSEINRVLKPDAGIYLVDFSRLKSQKSIQAFAYQNADKQVDLFTLDYLYSLQAAFTIEDFKKLCQKHFSNRFKVYTLSFLPFMMTIKSDPRRKYDLKIFQTIMEIKNKLPKFHQKDISTLVKLFKLGGMNSMFLK